MKGDLLQENFSLSCLLQDVEKVTAIIPTIDPAGSLPPIA